MISLKGILLLYFFIGFISDIALNYLSRQSYSPKPVKALKIYFQRKTIKSGLMRLLISAFNAGLTIVVALIITMIISKFLFGFSHPLNFKSLFKFILLAFIIGYGADVFIYKTQLFGETLNPYYNASGGAGLWGALAFIFSILLAYTSIKMLI
jgi:hypothetical protein